MAFNRLRKATPFGAPIAMSEMATYHAAFHVPYSLEYFVQAMQMIERVLAEQVEKEAETND